MMYKNKSVDILKVIIKICYVLLALVLFFMWFILTGKMSITDSEGVYVWRLIDHIEFKFVFYPFLAVVPMGYIALALIDKLLGNIKKDIVFDTANTKILNYISVACIAAAVVGIVSTVVSITSDFYDYIYVYVVLAAGEFFMALVLQVIKQVFEKAIEIKEENELTI